MWFRNVNRWVDLRALTLPNVWSGKQIEEVVSPLLLFSGLLEHVHEADGTDRSWDTTSYCW